MTEAETPLNGRRVDSRFTLLEKLGSGGQGEVWRAHDETRGVDIALKVPPANGVPNETLLAAFEREHAIAARQRLAGIGSVPARLRKGRSTLRRHGSLRGLSRRARPAAPA